MFGHWRLGNLLRCNSLVAGQLRMERLKDFKTAQEKGVSVGTLCSWIAEILIGGCTVADFLNCMLSVWIDWLMTMWKISVML